MTTDETRADEVPRETPETMPDGTSSARGDGGTTDATASPPVEHTATGHLSQEVERASTYLFSADRTAPRRRRASDITLFLVMAVVVGLLGWVASKEPPLDQRVFDALSGLPGWLRFLGWVGYTGSSLVLLTMLVVMLLRGGIGRGVLRDFLVVMLLIAVLGVTMSWLTSDSWPMMLPELDDSTRLTFPTLRTSIVLSGVMVLTPYVTAPVQRLFRWTAVAAVISPLLLSITTVTHILGAIALSFAAVAGVRLLFGSPEGLPPVNRLADTLRRIGVEVNDLAYLDEQPGTVGLARARDDGGREMSIKIYGQDAARRQRAERIWRAMWYRRAGPTPAAGRIEQAQHESLAILSCQVAGVGAPELIAGGQDVGGDVVVVSYDPPGVPLRDLDPERADADLRVAVWGALDALHHRAGVAHGSISPDTVRVTADDRVSFTDLEQASTLPTQEQWATDLVSLLASTATIEGPDAAVEGITSAVDHDRLGDVLPYVQEAAIGPELRREVKHAGFKVSDLRSGLADALDIEEPELAPIRRVSVSDIVMIVFAILAANALISQIADVGFDVLVEELRNASAGWLVAAFLVKILSYSTAYIGLHAVVGRPIPFAPTTLLQSAKSYVGLVVPSMVGRVGLDIRFLQKQGVSTTVAATQGPVISLIGFTVEVMLLLLSAWAMGQAVETDELVSINVGALLVLAIVVVIVGIVVVLVVPKLRNKVLPVARDAFEAIRSIVTSPAILGQVYLSEFLERIFGALALACTVAAFGEDLPFMALIFVSVGTGLLAGLAPVPGGIGVAEATMSALLTAVGVDPALSVSIAIVHRLVTSYLPPVLGFFSFNWETKNGYL